MMRAKFAAAQSGLRPEDHRLSSPAALLQTHRGLHFAPPIKLNQ